MPVDYIALACVLLGSANVKNQQIRRWEEKEVRICFPTSSLP